MRTINARIMHALICYILVIFSFTYALETSSDKCLKLGSVINCQKCENLNLPPFIKDTRSVSKLSLYNCNITSLNKEDTEPFSSIVSLVIRNTSIGTLSTDSFRGLKDLILLEMQDCEVRELHSDLLTNNGKLVTLKITSCKTKFLDRNFTFPQSLRTIQLYGNSINETKRGMFASNYKLEMLDLSSNKILQIYNQTFNFSDSAKDSVLRLSHNMIREIEDNSFMWCSTLTELDLSYNRISSLDVTTFRGLTSLRRLRLNNNQLSHVIVGLLNPLTTLESLFLHNNYVNDVEARTFEQCNSLIILSLSENAITVLKTEAFLGLANIRTLHLDNNNIERIERNAFSSLNNLAYLWIQNNNITSIGSNTLSSVFQLHIDRNSFLLSQQKGSLILETTEVLSLHFRQSSNVEAILSYQNIYDDTFGFNVDAFTSNNISEGSLQCDFTKWDDSRFSSRSLDISTTNIDAKKKATTIAPTFEETETHGKFTTSQDFKVDVKTSAVSEAFYSEDIARTEESKYSVTDKLKMSTKEYDEVTESNSHTSQKPEMELETSTVFKALNSKSTATTEESNDFLNNKVNLTMPYDTVTISNTDVVWEETKGDDESSAAQNKRIPNQVNIHQNPSQSENVPPVITCHCPEYSFRLYEVPTILLVSFVALTSFLSGWFMKAYLSLKKRQKDVGGMIDRRSMGPYQPISEVSALTDVTNEEEMSHIYESIRSNSYEDVRIQAAYQKVRSGQIPEEVSPRRSCAGSRASTVRENGQNSDYVMPVTTIWT